MEIKRNDPCSCGSGKRYKKCCAVGQLNAFSPGPKEASYYVIQGNAMHDRGDFEEALRLHREALSVDPDYALAYFNIGGVLRELGRIQEAAASYEKALSLEPEDPELCAMIGSLYDSLGLAKEACDFYKKALSVNRKTAEAYVKLGDLLTSFGRIEEADVCYKKALLLKPAYAEAYCSQGYSLLMRGMVKEAVVSFQEALVHKPDYPKTQILLAICDWINGDWVSCRRNLDVKLYGAVKVDDEKFIWPYFYFLDKLLSYKEIHQDEYVTNKCIHVLYVIGDSHTLSMANTEVFVKGVSCLATAKIIIGCKAWHLACSERNEYKYAFEKAIESVPVGATVVVNIGEIDCRLDEGIIKHHRKTNNNLYEEIDSLVSEYIEFVSNKCGSRDIKPLVCNIPLWRRGKKKISDSDIEITETVLKKFNQALVDNCAKREIKLLDVNYLSKNNDGTPKNELYLDNHHLVPAFFKHLIS